MPKIASYVVESQYPGRKPFLVGHFTIESSGNFHHDEHRAERVAEAALCEFFEAHFPTKTEIPEITKVMLGSLVFVPEDAH